MTAAIAPARTVMAMSAETATVIGMLRKMTVGEVLTYATLSEAIGCDVRKRRHVLKTARDRVLADDSVHTAIVATVGVKRLSDEEAGDGLSSSLRRARSAARRGRKSASRLNINEIPQEKRAAVFARASLLELIDYSGSAKAAAKAIAVAASSPDEKVLPLRRMLAALKE